jgi:multidrug efflux pump subunit AcrA (membrane-fusion protein)
MTVVQPRPLSVRLSVPEGQLQNVRPGLSATLEPAGYNNLKLTGVVQRVAAVPGSTGTFDGQLTVALDKPETEPLMPGMTAEVRLVPYKKADALTVPPRAVMTDELDPQKHFVYLLGTDDKPERRPVTLGRRNERAVEILKGLAEGDRVLLERPKDE